jgi:agmatine deiminase
VNFNIANGAIVMPRFGVPGDARVRTLIRAAFPDREVVQVDITDDLPSRGGIHCLTQQQPG